MIFKLIDTSLSHWHRSYGSILLLLHNNSEYQNKGEVRTKCAGSREQKQGRGKGTRGIGNKGTGRCDARLN